MLAGDVAALAVPARRGGRRSAPRSGAVEHRPQVVGHAAVDGDPGRDVALDRLDRVERDGRRWRRARGRARSAAACPGRGARARRATFAVDVLLDRRRLLVGRVGDAEAAAEVVGREVAERRERLDRRAERRRARSICEPMCMCRPDRSSCARAAQRARSPPRASSRPKPNFVSAWPVEIVVVRVAGDAGRDADQHRAGDAALGGDRARAGRCSSNVSTTMWPTPASSACASSRVATSRCRAGRSAPGRSRRAARGAARRRRRRRSRGPPRRAAGRRRCTGTPWRRRGRRSRRGAPRSASTNARARARMSSSATTYAGVPNSRASSTASQPPTSRWPRSLMRLPSGIDVRELWRVRPSAAALCRRVRTARSTPAEVGDARRPRLRAVAARGGRRAAGS